MPAGAPGRRPLSVSMPTIVFVGSLREATTRRILCPVPYRDGVKHFAIVKKHFTPKWHGRISLPTPFGTRRLDARLALLSVNGWKLVLAPPTQRQTTCRNFPASNKPFLNRMDQSTR